MGLISDETSKAFRELFWILSIVFFYFFSCFEWIHSGFGILKDTNLGELYFPVMHSSLIATNLPIYLGSLVLSIFFFFFSDWVVLVHSGFAILYEKSLSELTLNIIFQYIWS